MLQNNTFLDFFIRSYQWVSCSLYPIKLSCYSNPSFLNAVVISVKVHLPSIICSLFFHHTCIFVRTREKNMLSSCVLFGWDLTDSSPSPHSLHLSVRWVSSPPGWGASLPHPVPWAVSWLVRGGTAGGIHHRFTVGPGEAYHGKTERRTPGQWLKMQDEVQNRLVEEI